MADTVQVILERMIPELQDLQERGIFSEDEVKSIIRRRRSFEYLFMKRTPNEDDFARAIEFELSIESLRLKRKERLGLKKTTLSDHAGMRRIHFIFDRACRKFRADTKWWLQWIDYSMRTNASKASSRIFARALQLHPLCEDLWLQAATFEYDRQNNIAGARAIMLRSIRVNPNSLKLWLAYFRMECLYVLRMKSRRLLLGLDVGETPSAPSISGNTEKIGKYNDPDERDNSDYDVYLPNLDKDVGEVSDEIDESAKRIGVELAKGLQSLSSDDPSLSEFATALVTDIQASISDALKSKKEGDEINPISAVSSLAIVPSDLSPLAAFFQGSVPRIVYSQALKQLSSTTATRLQSESAGKTPEMKNLNPSLETAYYHISFLKAATEFVDYTATVTSDELMFGLNFSPQIRSSCAPFAFPSLVQHILDTAVEDCPHEPIVWETLAMMPFIPILKGVETRKKIRNFIQESKATGLLKDSIGIGQSSSSGPIQAVENAANDDLFMIDTGGDAVVVDPEEALSTESQSENNTEPSKKKKRTRKERKRTQNRTSEVLEQHNTLLVGISPVSRSKDLLPNLLTESLKSYNDFVHLLSTGILDSFVLDGSLSVIRNNVERAFAAAGFPTNVSSNNQTLRSLGDSIVLFSEWTRNSQAELRKAPEVHANSAFNVQTHFLEASLLPLEQLSLPLWSTPVSSKSNQNTSSLTDLTKNSLSLTTPNSADPLPLKGDDVSLVRWTENGAKSSLAVLDVAFETAVLGWTNQVAQWKKKYKFKSNPNSKEPDAVMSDILSILKKNSDFFSSKSPANLSELPLPFVPFSIGTCSIKCLIFIASLPLVQSTYNTARTMKLYETIHMKIMSLKAMFFHLFDVLAYIPSLSLTDKAHMLYFSEIASTLHAIHLQVLLRLGRPLVALEIARSAIFLPFSSISQTPWVLYVRLHAILRYWYNIAVKSLHPGSSGLESNKVIGDYDVSQPDKSRKRSRKDSKVENELGSKFLLSQAKTPLVCPLQKFTRLPHMFIEEQKLFPIAIASLASQNSINVPHLKYWGNVLDSQIPISLTLELGLQALESVKYPLQNIGSGKSEIRSFAFSKKLSGLCDTTFPHSENQAALWVMLLSCSLSPDVDCEYFPNHEREKYSAPSNVSKKAGQILEVALTKSLGTESESLLRDMYFSYSVETNTFSSSVLRFALHPNADESVHYNTLGSLISKLKSIPVPNIVSSNKEKLSYTSLLQTLRNYFEVSLSTHGQSSVQLWQLALQFEKDIIENHEILQLLEGKNRKSKVSDLYSKALRTLSVEYVPILQEMLAIEKA